MRILYIINYYKPAYIYGGPVRSTSLLCEALAKLGAKVTVLTTNVNGTSQLDVPLGQSVAVDGVEVFYYPIVPIPPRSFFYSPALAQACHQKVADFDIAVLDTFFTHAMGPAAAACKQAQVPYIVPTRGQLLPWALQHRHLKKQLYLTLLGRGYLNGAAAIHCTIPAEAEAVVNLGLKTPTIVIPNGLEVSRWEKLPLRGSLRQRLGIPTEAIMLLCLGRLHQVKQPHVALESLAALGQANVHLVYAGPDEEGLEGHLRAQAQLSNCAFQVHFTGLLAGAEVLQALADADLLLMPSMMESFGMSALEAMAAGLPVLTSQDVPVGRWADAIGAGRAVEGTAEAFTKALRELLAQPNQLKIMGQRGQTLVRQKFDIMAVAQQMLTQYQAILDFRF